ncbi:hydroxyacylglutathione hydrolase [Paludibacterium yongneupense]|uniref:hydroxyacylglutathione hydrolase n=1 Tax=Paludibacterium yongneupense TaxID=400061 RepID=UPI00041D6A82|nr:hydroxyacylglutathione hydrolase [Paludibacterium yongneupense]
MLTITPLPAFNDNYIWVLHSESHAVAVDPGAAAPLTEFLTRQGLTLDALLLTHHHDDHTGGVAALRRDTPSLTVYGPPAIATHGVAEGDRIEVLGREFRVLALPGHTLDHIAYLGAGDLFCGDTLFGAGCGRVFEGTPEQMHDSLQRLTTLPPETRIYPAHEYTLSNLAFARAIEPGNDALQDRIVADRASRGAGRPTLPSTLALEMATNPFLRVDSENVRRSAENHYGSHLPLPVDIFRTLRQWKNVFQADSV